MTQTVNNKLNYTHLKIQYIFLKKLFCSHIILTINFQLLFSGIHLPGSLIVALFAV